MSKHRNNILLIGPRQGHSGKVGGIVILFENLLRNLGTAPQIVDSNSANYPNKITMFFEVIRSILNVRGYKHVSLHGTARDYLIFGPVLLLVSMTSGKTYSLRKFAGSFDDYYHKLNMFNRLLLKLVLKNSSANFFETMHLVNEFKRFNSKTFWFPNVRPKQKLKSIRYDNDKQFKLLYLSQVSADKGVLDLISAVNSIEGVSLTIAGPIVDSALSDLSDRCGDSAEYIGLVDNDSVYEFMSNFHCLALPTFYSGEGYPGVIIEAFMVGLPVISTSWRSIPELVGDGGILVDVKSVEQIKNAIYLMMNNHVLYQKKSISRSVYFNDSKNTTDYLNIINGDFDE